MSLSDKPSYSNVTLCYRNSQFGTFECREFSTFTEADKFALDNLNGKYFPVCKYVPNLLKNFIIHQKLSNTFIKHSLQK